MHLCRLPLQIPLGIQVRTLEPGTGSYPLSQISIAFESGVNPLYITMPFGAFTVPLLIVDEGLDPNSPALHTAYKNMDKGQMHVD